MYQIKQGDAYIIPIDLTIDGEKIDAKDIKMIEVYFGKMRHVYPNGDLTYKDGTINLPIKQEDTLPLPSEGGIAIDVRVKFNTGDVIGLTDKIYVTVRDAVSEEVL